MTTRIRKRKTQYFVHVGRHESLQKIIILYKEKLLVDGIVIKKNQLGWITSQNITMLDAPSTGASRELCTELNSEQ